MRVALTLVDTACVLLDLGGFRLLTDPVLDGAGRLYHHGFGAASRKTGAPAVADLGRVDAVLLSHHQHQDNFDAAGRAFTRTVPRVVSTRAAAKALPGVTGLAPWESMALDTPLVPGLRVTATPARHRPAWLPELFSGPSVGFVLEWEGQDGALYFSGDTVFFDGVAEVGRRFRVGTAVLHAGAARFGYLTGPGLYTMNAAGVLRAVEALDPRRVVPIHHSGWKHFSEPLGELRPRLERDPLTADRTLWLEPGARTELPG